MAGGRWTDARPIQEYKSFKRVIVLKEAKKARVVLDATEDDEQRLLVELGEASLDMVAANPFLPTLADTNIASSPGAAARASAAEVSAADRESDDDTDYGDGDLDPSEEEPDEEQPDD